jgi:pre-mRNA-processing factor SLU7
VSVKY